MHSNYRFDNDDGLFLPNISASAKDLSLGYSKGSMAWTLKYIYLSSARRRVHLSHHHIRYPRALATPPIRSHLPSDLSLRNVLHVECDNDNSLFLLPFLQLLRALRELRLFWHTPVNHV